MDFQETHSWTLVDLVRAFLEFAFVYFLLCGSAFAFFTLKFLSIFGFFLPCPCKDFFGFRNSNLCLHELLLDWPTRKICSVRRLALEKFPFDLLLLKDLSCSNSNENLFAQRNLAYEVQKLEHEASCSSYSAAKSRYLVDRENSYDAKGKRVVNSKRRSGIRCRRKAAREHGNISSPIIFRRPLLADDTHVTCLQKDDCDHSSKATEGLYCTVGDIDRQQDDEVVATGNDVDEKSCHSFEFNVSAVDNKELVQLDNYTSSMEYANYVQDKIEMVGNEVSRIKMLEQALEEEKAARIALYLELEKERAAAATAADEAMAMIFRLQEEKASIEMEMRQYQRVIEERFAYNEGEMDILKEILIRKEKENHTLEREIETYRHMGFGGNDLSPGETNEMEGGCSLFNLQEDLLLDLTEADNARHIDSSNSNELPSVTTVKTCKTGTLCSSCDRQEKEKDCERTGKVKDGLHGSTIDLKPIVFDVHVIDGTIGSRKEESSKGNGFSCNSAVDGHGDCNQDRNSVGTNAQLSISNEPKDSSRGNSSVYGKQ